MRPGEGDDTDLKSCGGDDMLMRGVGMPAVLDGVAPAVFGLPDGVAEPLRCGDGVPALLDAAAPACSRAGVVSLPLRFGVLSFDSIVPGDWRERFSVRMLLGKC